jgi:hypothetical protein
VRQHLAIPEQHELAANAGSHVEVVRGDRHRDPTHLIELAQQRRDLQLVRQIE